ncbi:MAG: paraquat-inducible protein A [Crocinitomicaceae bacterium]
MKNIRTYFIAATVVALTFLSLKIFSLETEKRELKSDLIELSDVKYGVFNVDEWKEILTTIFTKKIDEFEIAGKDRKEMRVKIKQLITDGIADFKAGIKDRSLNSVKDFLMNSALSLNEEFDLIEEDIPALTDRIMEIADDPNNKKLIKNILINKLDGYADSTFAEMDYTVRDSLLLKYDQTSVVSAKNVLQFQLNDLQDKSRTFKYMLLGLAILVASLMFLFKEMSRLEVALLSVICSFFLVIGLFLPMIEIDARLANVSMTFMGEGISFQDQVLYFKSKSIVEVVTLMLTQGGVDLLIVGILVFLFSVLFPWAKLISGVVLVFSSKLQDNKVLNFLVFKTGKWSMADVMVVAIFMAYIGFSGILTEQLDQIQGLSSKIELLTTNESNLQIGFYSFAMFAVLGLLLSGKVKRLIQK